MKRKLLRKITIPSIVSTCSLVPSLSARQILHTVSDKKNLTRGKAGYEASQLVSTIICTTTKNKL